MDLLRNLFKGDKVIWIIFLLLCLVSIIEVFSASSTLTYKSGDHWRPITMHIILMLVGAVVVVIVHNIPCRWFKTFILLLPVSWILLISVLAIGALTNGARRWIDLGFIQFQPSELAKMGTIITVAYILSRMQEENGANSKAFRYILYVTGFTCLLIFTENLSTAVLLAFSVLLMMYVGRIPFRQLGALVGIGAAALFLALATIKFVPAEAWDDIGLHRMVTWQSRLDNHFDTSVIPPEKFDIDADAQIAHANIAIASSGILGKGPGNSVQRDFLSQAFSDFIYAIIIEELGLVGGGIVAFLYIWLLMRIGRIARSCDKSYYAFLVMGIGFLLVTQAMFNMLVAVGIMPVTGQPLPLISKGGTSTLVNCAYIGIVLSISRHINELKKREAQAAAEEQQAQVHEAAISLLQNAAELAKEQEKETKETL
ncbi:FtsW/RodA/SpoVE family cell cycle protein [Bacteroides gallinaceum]|mgnify:FL=1|uniref:Probable peptidoglycan glycosyltransferase FtsW n=2 Tax=Bacteroidaceae TaxID=815 RepID=A0ABT7X9L8_9BACE|nr:MULTISPECIES: FtsW/RodA/SpoVE family cell cycle protein [Bacteroidaceae]HJD10851.1 FtsW/RodA/SpoVE family cell cycle protein [Candidatus Phocaeicola caecigallinarum]MBD8041530.1 FtsW/RodA/SpoVE family cell cycle protein [Phocaeicola intestinalis]MBM6720547.1 FtsW/RodA/SpoVE family cell cycle protein [Bacteroides gallinaceum]MBM6945064.1 FtsW/RodA/SpoVE family cell cycle protein [Bacteroides gallinaceum]MDN0050777.1 FtsW/RodA/SpoVE family cell cycle protein [Bacteroides gallinaceum]